MESSTIAPEDDSKTKSRRVSKTRDGHRSRSQSHNIAKPLPKTPPASTPTQLQSSILPEVATNPSPPLIAPPPAVTRAPSSSRTPKVASSTFGHGHSRSTSILKVDMVKPGSNWDARLPHGGSRVTPVKSPGASSDNNHQRSGSSSIQHSRNPSSDVEGRRAGPGAKTRGPSLDRQATRPSLDVPGVPSSSRGRTSAQRDDIVPRGITAAPASSRRGPSVDNRHEGGRSSSAQHSRVPSDSEGRRVAAGPPKIRGPIFDQENGPNQDGIEGSRPIIFDVESRIAGNSIRPVKKRGPSADPETRRRKVSASRDPSLDRGQRPLDGSSPIGPNHRGPSFEANAERRRPGLSASDSGHHNPWIKQPKAAFRGKAAASASDNGHLNPQASEGRRGPQGNPIRFNSTPTNPLINYRGYTPVPVNNVDDEEQGHVQETSTRLSHEKTLEDMPSFTLSRPYPGKKDADDPEKQKFNREARRRHLRILLVSFAIIGLLILAIVLLVKFVRSKILTAIDTIGSGQETSPSDNATLSQEQTQCLSDFRTNAPSSPTTYACSTCLPTLRGVSSQFLQNGSNANDANDIQSARQFCGLQAVFNLTGQFQAGLSTLGWLKNTQTCTWGGISCDATGAVSALNLTFPSVPQTLPPEMSALSSLKRLQIVGDRSVPAGPLISGMPASLQSLQLYNTHLEGLATADASWFQPSGGLSGLTELIMDGNPSLGTSLPSGLFDLPLQTLVVRNQQLNMQLDELGNSGGIASALTTLDLSINNLTGTLGLLFLPHLTRLDLSNNNLLSIPPILTWPASLQTVHFQNNPTLNGKLASSLCANPSVIDCNFQFTGFSAANITCGTCRF